MKKERITWQASEALPLALLLTLSGGLMDAYSYMCRGGVFANAQTGNILLLGVNISIGNFSEALQYLFPIISFAVGVVIAEVIRHKFLEHKILHWRQLCLATEVIVLFGVGFIPLEMNLIANSLISLACGAQVQSFRKVHGRVAATTMCIGNLRTATNALSDYFYTRNKAEIKIALKYFLLLLIFIIGAVLGNILVEVFAEKAIFASSIILLIGLFVMVDKKEV